MMTTTNANRLRSHTAIDRMSHAISMKDKIRIEEIQKGIKVFDLIDRMSELKWNWMGHMTPQDRHI